MSLRAVSGEHFANRAYFEVFMYPSKLSIMRSTTFLWRSFAPNVLMAWRTRPLYRTCFQAFTGAVEGSVEAPEKPLQPWRKIRGSSLLLFQLAVVVAAFRLNLGRHAVESIRASVGTGKKHIGNRARNSAVAVIEGVNRHEPEMGLCRP